VAIDLGSEALMLALLLTAWIWRWRADPARLRGTENWWHANKTRVLQFGIWGFLQNQCGVLYGSAPNRLVAAHYLPTTEVALYGLADNLSNLMRRFMPTQLFIGLIRPVAMAKFSATGDFTPLAWMANLVYRLNLSILVLGIALLTTVGEPLLGAFTGGKYASSALLIAGMFVLIASEGMRSLMELMAQAVERNQVLFFTNLVQSASLILSIPLLPTIGLWALIVANLSGTVLANFLVLYHLRRGGYRFRLSLGHVASVIAYGLASGALGAWLAAMDLHFLVAALGVGGLYIALMLFRPPLDPDERKTLLTLLHYKIAKRSARQRPGAVPAEGEARP
jgi:O-antigen/teichoic acid export membrane protein